MSASPDRRTSPTEPPRTAPTASRRRGSPTRYGQQPAYGQQPYGQQPSGDQRPGTVTAAAWITIVFSAITAALFGFADSA